MRDFCKLIAELKLHRKYGTRSVSQNFLWSYTSATKLARQSTYHNRAGEGLVLKGFFHLWKKITEKLFFHWSKVLLKSHTWVLFIQIERDRLMGKNPFHWKAWRNESTYLSLQVHEYQNKVFQHFKITLIINWSTINVFICRYLLTTNPFPVLTQGCFR